MPLYDYRCKCGHTEKDMLVLNSAIVRCPSCGNPMDKDFSAMRPKMIGDIPEHYDESLGVVIKSRKHLREVLYLTNSRTDDITPVGGLVKEEREIRTGIKEVHQTPSFNSRNGSVTQYPDDKGIIDDEGVDISQ